MFEAILRIFRRACGINNDCLITTRPPRTITAVGLGALALWSRFASFARVPGIRHFPGLASHVSRPRHEKCEEQEFRSQLSSTSGLSVTLAGVDADLIPEQTENFSLHTPRIEWEQGCTSLNFIHDIIDSVQGDEATIHDPDVYDLKHNPCSQVITPYSEVSDPFVEVHNANLTLSLGSTLFGTKFREPSAATPSSAREWRL